MAHLDPSRGDTGQVCSGLVSENLWAATQGNTHAGSFMLDVTEARPFSRDEKPDWWHWKLWQYPLSTSASLT